jgi:hypothetical protein
MTTNQEQSPLGRLHIISSPRSKRRRLISQKIYSKHSWAMSYTDRLLPMTYIYMDIYI